MTTKTPMQKAEEALDSIELSFEKDHDDMLVGADEFLSGCDSLASALEELEGVDDDQDASPLDEVLAELGVDNKLVDDVADLLKLAGRMSYGGPIYTDADKTISQLEDVVVGLRDVLVSLAENSDTSDSDDEDTDSDEADVAEEDDAEESDV